LVVVDALLTVLIDKSRIVEEGNYHKFTKSKESKHFTKMLLDTGDRELVEVSRIEQTGQSNLQGQRQAEGGRRKVEVVFRDGVIAKSRCE
jgi:predicted NAD-dependent protein-ADP-ribosyltransferase YbiA (DUF1768 family)